MKWKLSEYHMIFFFFIRFHKKKPLLSKFCSFCSYCFHCIAVNLYEVWALLSQLTTCFCKIGFKQTQCSQFQPQFFVITIHIVFVIRNILCGRQHNVSGKKIGAFQIANNLWHIKKSAIKFILGSPTIWIAKIENKFLFRNCSFNCLVGKHHTNITIVQLVAGAMLLSMLSLVAARSVLFFRFSSSFGNVFIPTQSSDMCVEPKRHHTIHEIKKYADEEKRTSQVGTMRIT